MGIREPRRLLTLAPVVLVLCLLATLPTKPASAATAKNGALYWSVSQGDHNTVGYSQLVAFGIYSRKGRAVIQGDCRGSKSPPGQPACGLTNVRFSPSGRRMVMGGFLDRPSEYFQPLVIFANTDGSHLYYFRIRASVRPIGWLDSKTALVKTDQSVPELLAIGLDGKITPLHQPAAGFLDRSSQRKWAYTAPIPGPCNQLECNGIYIRQPGGSMRFVTRGHDAEFSPDGRRLLVIRTKRREVGNPEPETDDLYVIDTDGRHLRRSTKQARGATWSPDGRLIAFQQRGDTVTLSLRTGTFTTVLSDPLAWQERREGGLASGLSWRPVFGP